MRVIEKILFWSFVYSAYIKQLFITVNVVVIDILGEFVTKLTTKTGI